mgnify:FL=1
MKNYSLRKEKILKILTIIMNITWIYACISENLPYLNILTMKPIIRTPLNIKLNLIITSLIINGIYLIFINIFVFYVLPKCIKYQGNKNNGE